MAHSHPARPAPDPGPPLASRPGPCDDPHVLKLDPPAQVYVCDACPLRVRIPADSRIPMHNCTGRALLSVPLIREGERVDVRPVPRDDYVGGDQVRTDATGAVFMRCDVERADRIDTWVYAPVATACNIAR